MSQGDTIAAVATARGRAALAIVRVSGPGAVPVADSCFRGADLTEAASHTVHVGYVVTPDGREVDQVVTTIFRAPRSATGEDVVEISCHGGDFAPQLILEALIAAGARMAAPGEFTQRAFLNGKLDLAQAEAVADLIHASSSLAHRVSLSHLQGRYSSLLQRLRDEILQTCALVELELDFSEEDVEFADRDRLEGLIRGAETLLGRLLSSYEVGARLRDGVRVVIGGRPNAGKSTLLNALVGRDRAIVSEVPGTTRDEIEAEAEIEGLLFRFVDTAGLREAADFIEAEGVRRAKASIESSDILLYVYDLSVGLDEEERAFLERIRNEQPALPVVMAGNKADLVDGAGTVRQQGRAAEAPAQSADPAAGDRAEASSSDVRGERVAVALSALQGVQDGREVRPLVEVLVGIAASGLSEADASPVVMNQRHRQHLRRALEAVSSAGVALQNGVGGDTLALDLRAALHELGAITGEITNEDVLDQIFSRFCIGK